MTKHPKHPAAYSDVTIPVLAQCLIGAANVLDPMGGTGKLAKIKAYGFTGRVVCNDLHPKWKKGYAVDDWHNCDAAAMPWALDASFEAICTSPTYGNRMADHHNARDASRRNTYQHRYPGNLKAESAESTCVMQWGAAYRHKHTSIYRECLRVLKPGGLLVVNVSDHIRAGRRVYVSKWTLDTLRGMGLILRACHAVKTPRNRFGANAALRCPVEYVFVLAK